MIEEDDPSTSALASASSFCRWVSSLMSQTSDCVPFPEESIEQAEDIVHVAYHDEDRHQKSRPDGSHVSDAHVQLRQDD